MRDFERAMLVIYEHTVEADKVDVPNNVVRDALGMEAKAFSELGMLLNSRGFVTGRQVGSVMLSDSGITYVETRLR